MRHDARLGQEASRLSENAQIRHGLPTCIVGRSFPGRIEAQVRPSVGELYGIESPAAVRLG
jgi:hypothetical protein